MALLQTLGKGQGYLKAGLFGGSGSGKTYTAMLMALGLRKYFNIKGPIAMFDTEGGSEYIAHRIKKETGLELVGVKSRSFDELMAVGNECVSGNIQILMVDSITHVWREVCAAYLKQKNDFRISKGWNKLGKLEFQHWQDVKNIWERYTTFYLNSPLHILCIGRGGYTYDMEKDEESGKKELVKTGTKMKVEGEFGFEPSLLIEMERESIPDGKGGFEVKRLATVIKDRFAVIDAATAYNPTFDFFLPHIQLLNPSAHSEIDTNVKTDAGVGEDGEGEYARERKTRTILCEEIQGELVTAYPGQDKDSKAAKGKLIYDTFGTHSWTAVEGMESGKLREGLRLIRQKLGTMKAEENGAAVPAAVAGKDDIPM